MRRLAFGHRAGSVIVAAGLLVAGVLLLTITGTIPVSAQAGAGDVPMVEIPVRTLGRYTMPRGRVVTRSELERKLAALQLRERRRPQPKYAAEVVRLKNLPASRNVQTRYAPAATVDTTALNLSRRCNGGEGDGGSFVSNGSLAVSPQVLFQANAISVVVGDLNCDGRSEVLLDGVLGLTGNEHAFEPHVVYDPVQNRFMLTALTIDFDNFNQGFRVAVFMPDGETAEIFGVPLQGNLGQDDFVSKPKITATGARTVVAAKVENLSGPEVTEKSVVASMKPDGTGTAAVFPVPVPVVPITGVLVDTPQEALVYIFLGFIPDGLQKSGRAGSKKIQRYELTLGNRPRRDRLRRKTPITIPAWRPPPNARQPNGQRLGTGDGSFTSPAVQIGDRIWAVHTVNDGGFARPRVYELSATGDTPLAVYQLSSVPEQNDHLFNASIAVNGAGANGIAFVNATRTIHTGRAAGRPAMVVLSGPHASGDGWESTVIKISRGQFSNVGFGLSCDATAQGFCNWGPYSSIQIDPLNKRRAWATNQLATTGAINGAGSDYNWSTVIGGVTRKP